MSLNSEFIKDIINAQNEKIEKLCKKNKLDIDNLNEFCYFTEEEINNLYYKNKCKITIKKKFPEPSQFDNEYEYFIKISELLKFKYYKYDTLQWEGPCIIIYKNDNKYEKIQKIKQKFKIETNIDYTSNDNIILYPKKFVKTNKIEYTNFFNKKKTINENKIELTEWKHDNMIFYLDVKTDNVYSYNDKLYIGKRYYSNDEWNIAT